MNNYCSNCGEPLAGAKFCPNCGEPVNSNGNVEFVSTEYREPSQRIQGAYNSATKPSKKGSAAGNALFTFLFIILFGMLVVIIGVNMAPNTKTASKLQKVTGVTDEQAKTIEDILKKCDIQRIDSIEADELLNDVNTDSEKGYRISADGIDNIILYIKANNKVNMIRYADNNLYAKGKVVSTMADYTFTTDEETALQIKCQNAVEEILKSSSTAKFPNILKWNFSKNKGGITVQSYVDSQNSFGATIRSEFQLVLTKDNKVKSFIFDGEELMKK